MSWKRGKIKQQMKIKHNKASVIQYCLKLQKYSKLTKNETNIYENFFNHHNFAVIYQPIIVRMQHWEIIEYLSLELLGLKTRSEGFSARDSGELRPQSQAGTRIVNSETSESHPLQAACCHTNWSLHSTGSWERYSK